jgi:hypothetical protein
MEKNYISIRQRAVLVGVLIITAYSMLIYSITQNVFLGVSTDIISGISVIGIAILMYPLFNNKTLNNTYLFFRIVEGLLMIIGGIFILNNSLLPYRDNIYNNIHIYFFILGALLFYLLLYKTNIIPKFISIWGIIATILLSFTTITKLFGITSLLLDILLIPIILNELFLAFWLIIKGFSRNNT